jgi:hypothetical protein
MRRKDGINDIVHGGTTAVNPDASARRSRRTTR